MNKFQQIKSLLDVFEIGDIISRKYIMSTLSGRPDLTYTLDAYRLHFTKAGYLIHIGRGLYKKAKEIPEKLSSRDLRKEAYPHYKNWNEYRYLR